MRGTAMIEFNNVGKHYASKRGGEFSAVKDFNLTIAKGQFFCLLGPSGCGKSTVLSMLAGFQAESSGQILVGGKPIAGESKERGVVFQGDDSLYPWLTAIENIEFGLRIAGKPPRERRERAMEWLHLVGLRGQQEKYPTELSGGMKQRIQIARALANEPQTLLMDEPFGALDAQTRGTMQRELRRIWSTAGTTVLFITHDIDEAIILGTHVGVMTAGPGGTLKAIVPIEIEGDRDRSDPQYGRYYEQIHNSIREEVERTTRADEATR